MKTLKNTFYILALICVLPGAAFAQTTASNVLSHDYENNPLAERNKHWWRALQEEVNLPRGLAYTEVTTGQLQDIIFFAQVHGDKVDFRASVPQLLDVYKRHENKGMRMMALAALHSIGDDHGMDELRAAVYEEESDHLRRLTLRALRDFQDQQIAAY